MLRNYVEPTQDDWDEHFTAAEFAINSAYQQSIKTSPFMLNYGQNPLTSHESQDTYYPKP